MGIKEKVTEKLDDEKLKDFWDKIYEAFSQKGKNGITEFLENEKNRIKDEFYKIKKDVDKQIGD